MQLLIILKDDSILLPAIPLLITLIGYIRYLLQKEKERRTVNRVILAEISRLLSLLSSHLAWWRGCIDDQNTDLPLIPFTTEVYDNFLKNIGDLNPLYAAEAVRFYGYIKFLNGIQQSRAKHKALQKLNLFLETYTISLVNALDKYKKEFPDAFRKYKIPAPLIDEKLIEEMRKRVQSLAAARKGGGMSKQ